MTGNATGELTLFSVQVKTGKRQILTKTRNMILDQMYEQFSNLLGGGTTNWVENMRFGTGTLAPAHDQTTLQRPITPVKAVSVSIAGNAVTFTAYLDGTEGNGFPISEAALACNDGKLVARTTFAARTKTSDYQFGFQWEVLVKAP